MKPKIVAIVPMRHVSERVQGKNYRIFAGKPLYQHIVTKLLLCPAIDTVMIDTDSDLILQDAERSFPNIKLYLRPDNLRSEMTPMNDVLLNSVNQIEADFYLQTHSTNPLLRSTSIAGAIDAFTTSLSKHDSLFSVTCLQTRLWDSIANPLNHDSSLLLRTQDLEPVFEENSCIYLFSKASLEKYKNRIGSRPMMYEIDKLESQDIDTEQDFTLAESLFKQINTQEFG